MDEYVIYLLSCNCFPLMEISPTYWPPLIITDSKSMVTKIKNIQTKLLYMLLLCLFSHSSGETNGSNKTIDDSPLKLTI